MRSFQPDTIIALGGGSPMDAAKAMWLFYEQPQVDFEDLVQKFMDIRNARSAFLNWAAKPNLSAFLPRREQAPKSRRLPSSATATKNIRLPTTH